MILIIDKNEKNATTLADMLSYMGIIAVGAAPSRAISLLSPVYSAAVLNAPNTLADAGDFVSRLRSYTDIPIFALAPREARLPFSGQLYGIFEQDTSAAKLLSYIREITAELSLRTPGDYRLAGIDASVTAREVSYFGRGVPLTKTETMILRALIRAYPSVTDARSILTYAFRPSRMPDAASIRTHISIINKKWRSAFGTPVIETSLGDGYRISVSDEAALVTV